MTRCTAISIFAGAALLALASGLLSAAPYTIVDTGLEDCYSDSGEITCPSPGQPFYGQDAQYDGAQPSYQDNGDGTVTDLNTGLMWQQTPDWNKSTYYEAVAGADTLSLGGYDDWRLPTIKELYSLIDFNGNCNAVPPVPYIDTAYFDFRWGDTANGERLIDAQYWSGNQYVGTVFFGDTAVFGVNFADGRIKGYPRDNGPGGLPMREFVRYVRDNPGYGVNDFVDNGDGTITDQSTGLMWQTTDDGVTRNWEEALAYAEGLQLAGYDDWRLPNAKELQSIVDYTRAPEAADPGHRGPAIDPVFGVSDTQSYFWTSTTHLEGPGHPGQSAAAYVAFGQAFGWINVGGNWYYLDVHGAGAQRSDPKSGNPDDWPHGFGPQGDDIRIYNYVRCVRGTSLPGVSESGDPALELNLLIMPLGSRACISYRLPGASVVSLTIYDCLGKQVKTLVSGDQPAGIYRVTWDGIADSGARTGSGIYFCRLKANESSLTGKLVLVR
jgi:hypothetical protein